jgi:UDP-N-acetyl-D-mannosaminuronic acid dehydrogenase
MLEMIKTRIKKKVSNILICGLAFKGIPATSDVRGSMALPIIYKIKNLFKKSKIELFDNLVDPRDLKTKNINYKIIKNYNYINNKYDLVLILNNNPLWKSIGIKKLKKLLKKKDSLIYDYWNSFNSKDYQYVSFGQGRIFT